MHVVLLAALATFSVARWGSAGDFVQTAAFGFLELAVIWWGTRYLARFNLLGYFLLTMLLILSPAIGELIRQPNTYFRVNGAVLIGAVAFLLVLTLAGWRGSARRQELADKSVVPV